MMRSYYSYAIMIMMAIRVCTGPDQPFYVFIDDKCLAKSTRMGSPMDFAKVYDEGMIKALHPRYIAHVWKAGARRLEFTLISFIEVDPGLTIIL